MMLVAIGVLSLLLAFPTPPYPFVRDPGMVFAAVAAAVLLPVLVAVWVRRRTLAALDAQPHDPRKASAVFGWGNAQVNGALLILHGGLLALTAWLNLCQRIPVVGGWPMVAGALASTPFLASVLLVWIALYGADAGLRRAALEESLLRGRPTHPIWTLRGYLAFNLRHQVLFILVPMFLILAARDVTDRYDEAITRATQQVYLPDLLLGAAAGLVALVAPALLRYIWDTRPLPEGPLRDRLLWLCEKLRMRCGEILIWRSGGMIVNAAVMGVVAPLRYVLISDAMLERMDDSKIEAVFGHEAGHVKRHHILYFLLFAFITGCWIMIAQIHMHGAPSATRDRILLLLGALLAVQWGWLFFWVSRQFERQADLYGVRTLTLSGLPCPSACPAHAAPAAAPPGNTLCHSAAHLFGDTLHEVGVLNGIAPEAWSWRHGSLAGRSREVSRLAQDPAAAKRFERQVHWIKAGIVAVALVSGAWAAVEMRLWSLLAWLSG